MKMGFHEWWRETGSGVTVDRRDDHEEHAKKVAAKAWDAALEDSAGLSASDMPPVPTQLLWMFDGIDRKEATKMMHDYALSAITWKPSKALLRAWEDVQNAEGKARRLEDELKNRDKCSFMGPMRDCPTHGESEELKHLRAEVSAWRERLGDDYEYRPDVPYVVMKAPNDQAQGEAQGSSRLSPGATGSAARDSEKENDSEHC